MDLYRIIRELVQERDRVERIIRSLEEARAEAELELPDADRWSLKHRFDRVTTRPSAWLRPFEQSA